jgi:hypothetical protein
MITIDSVPLTRLMGSTVDISPLLRFHFWDCVYYHKSKTSFPSDSKEGLGYIVGISEHCGNALMYKVLTADTGHVIYCSLLCPVSPDDVNIRASMFSGEPITQNEVVNEVVKSRHDFPPSDTGEYKPATTRSPSPVFNPQDLLGRPFLMDKQADGQRPRGTLVQLLVSILPAPWNN